MTIADVPRCNPAAGDREAPVRDRPVVAHRLLVWLRGPVGAGLIAAVVAVLVLGVMAGWFGALNILHGPPLWVPVGLAAICLAASVSGRSSRWWLSWGLGLAVATTVVVAVAHWWIRSSGLVLDKYPVRFVVFAWIAVAAVGVGLTGWWSGPAALRAVRVLAAPASVLAGFLLINSYYGYWPTVATLLNKPVAGQMSKQALAQLLGPAPLARHVLPHRLLAVGGGVLPAVRAIPATRVATSTRVPLGWPAAPAPTLPQVPDGHYGPVDIPGTAVGFAAAQAYLWLPPDFSTVPHAHLPVIVMLPGWPGNVQDWARAGGVTDTANAWARSHSGQAPVMLLIDENGASGRDTECVDSVQGRAESYLASRVPAFIEQTLGIAPDPKRWALVGYSEGGTCAITLALRHPAIYGRFVDIAGDWAPNYLGPTATLRTLFGGSVMAEYQHTPSWLLERSRYPGMAAWFATGSNDGLRPVNDRLAELAAGAGVDVRTSSTFGLHTWNYAHRAFNLIYPALVGDLSAAGAAATPAT